MNSLIGRNQIPVIAKAPAVMHIALLLVYKCSNRRWKMKIDTKETGQLTLLGFKSILFRPLRDRQILRKGFDNAYRTVLQLARVLPLHAKVPKSCCIRWLARIRSKWHDNY